MRHAVLMKEFLTFLEVDATIVSRYAYCRISNDFRELFNGSSANQSQSQSCSQESQL
jgi:hypothetical protein